MTRLVLLLASARAADLTVDAATLTLDGPYAHDPGYVINGGALTLGATTVHVDATFRIGASGAGYAGVVSGDGDGPGGGVLIHAGSLDCTGTREVTGGDGGAVDDPADPDPDGISTAEEDGEDADLDGDALDDAVAPRDGGGIDTGSPYTAEPDTADPGAALDDEKAGYRGGCSCSVSGVASPGVGLGLAAVVRRRP